MKPWPDMKNLWQKALISQPRWDGNRVQFAIEAEGKLPHLPTSDLLRRFVDSRERVEEIAALIFHITPEWVSGPVSIWADDIDDPPLTCALTREIIPLMGGVRCDLGLVS